jgi:hypothetical protein
MTSAVTHPMRLILSFTVLCFLLKSASGYSSETSKPESTVTASDPALQILIAAPKLSHLVEKDQTGIYQRLFRRALEGTPYSVRELFLPFRRALLEFEHHQVDCTYSFTEVIEEMLGEHAIISSFPLGAFSFHIFTRKNNPAISNLEQLKNLSIGAVNGQEHYYHSRLPPELNNQLKLLNTDKQGIEMLNLKRLDAYIGALPDMNPYVDSLTFDKTLVLYKSFDRITCHNTEKNQAFLNIISAQLEHLKNSGEYQRIAGDFYIDF